MQRRRWIGGVVAAIALAVAPGPAMSGAGPEGDDAVLQIRGEVVYLDIEGGFWGIVGDDGRRYDPGRLAADFRQPGLKVQVTARAERARVSFRMWGTPITIEHIERAPP